MFPTKRSPSGERMMGPPVPNLLGGRDWRTRRFSHALRQARGSTAPHRLLGFEPSLTPAGPPKDND